MTDQEKNIAIAETQGWQWWTHDTAGGIKWLLKGHQPESWNQTERPEILPGFISSPDYCHDLNAMHDVELSLSLEEKDRMGEQLDIIVAKYNDPLPIEKCLAKWQAKSNQRTEAYLRMKGLWKE
jgi:hypothetical protein